MPVGESSNNLDGVNVLKEKNSADKYAEMNSKFPQVLLLFVNGARDEAEADRIAGELHENIIEGKGSYGVIIPDSEKDLEPNHQAAILTRTNVGFPKGIVTMMLASGIKPEAFTTEIGILYTLRIPAIEPKKV